ncbi:MAG: NADPH:quinone reductase [Candidatus Methanoperedens nitroreducens]|uniref:NADPH:quinone reductase n=1 Tax=Candidatus Methanoperedens nitratireducens TaxID=1392998 RepID=A0A0P8C6G9_9EURY|nr:NADP-dependent oxidoreductase [Candidatus Methanoperedens sp. BLZ2]KAB2947473.1 MAG: NADP-dependent oxidoreductase [Candidatus Methanoperedens sp.]KPQ42335.1 MAG: NADPH:quinone reductase [Candidatus Methanoperedens sp. BLZ1]MBZ0175159.1 NADP-dependent oxidoreductase [Candidatus Methanoperedens nitroreducens]CAG0991039.1 alcohol dehydrogenase [Methanosarcinales archaeon]MCX9078722.1 NADP-dependent oxidoreductase [Candidatus Methanoperedens sp.]
MKAAQIKNYGGSEVVKINNAPKPSVSRGRLLIEVHASGVNPVDWKIREGYMKQMAPLQFPATLGGDFSGIVAELGEDVSGFEKGDEIYGQASITRGGSGSFAEFATADVNTAAHKPKNLSHVEAAALPLTGVSAWQALVDHIGLSRGKKILIHGGAGGIGTIAIQLARHLGAYVAATAGAKDLQYVKELGADEAIDYKNQSFENMLHNYDAVYDTVGGETYVKSFRVLKKGGIIVSMLEQPRSELMEQYGVNAIGQFTQINSERLSKVAELADKRVIKVHVDKTFPLEQAGEALEYLQSGHPRGKVVLKMKKN